MKVYCKDKIIVDQVKIADSFFTRLIGLMNKKTMEDDEGLLLLKCSSVHCFFMKFPIDVIYLSKDMAVLDIETLSPWRLGKHVKKAAHVLELSAGATKDRLFVGDILDIH